MTEAEREALVDKTTRAICQERCAFMGEPPCWDMHDWPNEECDEPGCNALARAALAVAEPVVREDEREACARLAEHNTDFLAAVLAVSNPTPELVAEGKRLIESAKGIAAAIRARGAA